MDKRNGSLLILLGAIASFFIIYLSVNLFPRFVGYLFLFYIAFLPVLTLLIIYYRHRIELSKIQFSFWSKILNFFCITMILIGYGGLFYTWYLVINAPQPIGLGILGAMVLVGQMLLYYILIVIFSLIYIVKVIVGK